MQIDFLKFSTKVWNRAVIVLLFGLAAFELFEAGKFFIVTYPELDLELTQHMVTQTEVYSLLGEAIASSISSGINMFFAVHLFKARERITHFLELIAGSSLVVWHGRMVEWLSSFNYVAIWERLW